jgi:hypothetical protein
MPDEGDVVPNGHDVWDNNLHHDEEKAAAGIGKLKISREMKAKLEALTSTRPNRCDSGQNKRDHS